MLKTFDSSYFIGKSYFEVDGVQNYLVFQPLKKYFKTVASSYYGTKTRLEFRGSCLKQDKSTFNHGKIVNIYIVYELDKTYVKTHPTLINCLFGAVSMTKNADIDKNKYSGYGIRFDRTGVYLLPDGSFG